MNAMKKAAVLLAAMLLAGMLSGCGKNKAVTAESLLEEAASFAEEQSSVSVRLELAIDAAAGETEDEPAFQEKVSADMDIVREARSMYAKANLHLSMGEEEQNETMEVYCVPEEESFGLYSSFEELAVRETVQEDRVNSLDWILDMPAEMKEAAPELEEGDDESYYVLKGTVTGDTLTHLANSMNLIIDLVGTGEILDLSERDAAIEYRIDREKHMPAEITVDLKKAFYGDESDVGSMSLTIRYVAWSDTGSIEIPSEVMEKLLDTDAAEEEEENWEEPAEDVLHETEDTTVSMTDASVDAPAGLNEWVKVYAMASDGEYYPIALRILDVTRGEEAAAYFDGTDTFAQPPAEGLEEAALHLEVYVPTDFPDAELGGVNLYITDPEGAYFNTEYDYFDQFWVELIETENLYVGPGETGQATGIFTVTEDLQDFMIQAGDSWGNETYIKP